MPPAVISQFSSHSDLIEMSEKVQIRGNIVLAMISSRAKNPSMLSKKSWLKDDYPSFCFCTIGK